MTKHLQSFQQAVSKPLKYQSVNVTQIPMGEPIATLKQASRIQHFLKLVEQAASRLSMWQTANPLGSVFKFYKNRSRMVL